MEARGKDPRGGARLIIALRWPIIVGWIAAAVAAVVLLPTLGGEGASPLPDVVPKAAPALQAAQRSTALFGAPAATDTVVVQRDASGLSGRAIAAHAGAARDTLAHQGRHGILGALPLANFPLPGARFNESSTTVLSYLFLAPSLNLSQRLATARTYERELAPEGRVGVTGAGPARLAQFGVIEDAL